MKCPLCQVELRITRSRNVVEHDDTPNEETKLYVEQELSCLNKGCVISPDEPSARFDVPESRVAASNPVASPKHSAPLPVVSNFTLAGTSAARGMYSTPDGTSIVPEKS